MKAGTQYADKLWWSVTLVILFTTTTVGLGLQALLEVPQLAPYFLPFLSVLIGIVLFFYFSQYIPLSKTLGAQSPDVLAYLGRWFQLTMIASSSIAVFASAMIGYLYHNRGR